MTSDSQNQSGKGPDNTSPKWANGLRQLYDSVVDEPLPDSFTDLLAQLDAKPVAEPSAGHKPKAEGGDHTS
ncbi:hypothetical protein GCM10023115_08780 [Pontixanthobacter gangjinensis]|uniref:Anti-sigma factor NepR domain-containing protein n=1 Tax=Pontixanthobacter gangjinensis TaxID=1028742 RepID=A0A6I4SKE9_9SPHN|nr:NepR family anti-sigma factor [Pontixanthobacter gangjinensis]MXO56124.1 hypothetical protein [Pontixanthobacter gangjinensis]